MREIDSIVGCVRWLEEGPARQPAAVQALDLREHAHLPALAALAVQRFDGSLFLGCRLTDQHAVHLVSHGALVIEHDPTRPYNVHRAQLYSVAELFATDTGTDTDGETDNDTDSVAWADTLDAVVYRHYVAAGGSHPTSIAESLAQRLHDHSITDALDEALAGEQPVAVMGGHALHRCDPAYATVARIARAVARRGRLLLSGGGPGAMEATHLGGWMAHFDDDQLDAAVAKLAIRPPGAGDHEYADPDWLQRALSVRRRWPVDDAAVRYRSIGIPTWAYGHEPPTPFATRIAKYFANSVREDGLLAIATGGVVFTPGSAGTVQEIFQDAAQNHYSTFGPPSPMVLFGVDYWTQRLPVWPLLQALAGDREYRPLITLTDDPDEVVERLTAHERAHRSRA